MNFDWYYEISFKKARRASRIHSILFCFTAVTVRRAWYVFPRFCYRRKGFDVYSLKTGNRHTLTAMHANTRVRITNFATLPSVPCPADWRKTAATMAKFSRTEWHDITRPAGHMLCLSKMAS